MIETFILQEYLSDNSICDKLIDFYHNDFRKLDGYVSNRNGIYVDHTAKKCTEVAMNPEEFATNEILKEYNKQLQEVCNKYINKYKWCNFYSPWGIVDITKIQYYKPNEGFYRWHTERPSGSGLLGSRHLAFMTYLNDVHDGGETEFYYQNIKIQPRKGLTVIWPTDWTYTHRGIPSASEDKYIITGWYNYYE